MLGKKDALINSCDVISFDLFDTLITRNFNRPTDLFDLIQNQIEQCEIGIKQFKLKRIAAEYQAHRVGGHKSKEVTLDYIYEILGRYYNVDLENLVQLKNMEIEMEENACEINREGYEIYQYCIQKKKKIIVCTDMYLPKCTIERILSKNKIVYDKLFLSNEIGCSKAFKGKLFKYVIQDLNIEGEKILHIGDNWKSDIFFSRLNMMKSMHISKKNHCTIYDRKNRKFEYEVLNNFINNHLNLKKDYYWKAGYQTLGPILYGLSIWLSEQLKRDRMDKIFFLSRDGFIIQKAFNMINPELENKYIYASRKALIIPTLWMNRDPKNLVTVMKFPRWLRVMDFLERMGLESSKYKSCVENCGYKLDSLINIEKEVKELKFQKLWEVIFKDIEKNSLNGYANAVNYLKKIDFHGKVAIIDIGWNGYMQQALEQLIKMAKIDADVRGYYLGVQTDSCVQNEYKMQGFLFQKNFNEDICAKLTFCRSLMETFFIAEHGSVKRYTEDGIEFLDFEYRDTKSLKILKKVQDGALAFVRDFSNYKLSKYLYIDPHTAITNFFVLGNNPSKLDVEKMGEILYLNDELRYLLPQVSRWRYYFNFKKFITDLKYSVWVTGLLKKVCIVNLNFFNVAMKLRKIYYGKMK